MKKQISPKIVSLIFAIFVICFAIAFYAFSWTGPSNVPPICPSGEPGCDPPINIGGASQYKSGALGIGGVFRAYSNAIIDGNVGIGTTSPGEKLDVSGNVRANAFYYSSDIRLKEDINPLKESLSRILKLNGISYKLKEDEKEKLGFSAQEVREIFPEIVNEDNEGMLSIDAVGLTAPLVESIKEQQNQIEEQQKEIKELKAEINELKLKIK